MIVVRFPGPRAEDFDVCDPDTLEEAVNHAGRLAVIRGVHVDPDAPDNALPIGETRADPRLDLVFADGWRWTAFLDEVDLVTKAERLPVPLMREWIDEALGRCPRTARDRLAARRRSDRRTRHA